MSMLPIYVLLFLAANALGFGVLFTARRSNVRQAAVDAEAGRIERIRQRGLRALVLLRGQQYAEQEGPLAERRDEHQRVRASLESHYAKVRKQLWKDGDWSTGFVVVVVALTLVWAFLFFLVRSLDVQMLEALGFFGGNQLMAQALGTIIALAFAVLGIAIAGLLDLHPFLPKQLKLSRPWRLLLVANLVAGALVLALWLQHIAIYRSQRVLGAQVINLQATVAVDQQPGGNPIDLRVAELRLAQAQQRLKAGESVDRTMATVGPLLETAVSWVPVYAGELLVLVGFGLGIRRHRRHELELASEINQLNRRFTRALTEDAIAAGFEVDDIERQLNRPPGLPAAGPADPPPQDVTGDEPPDAAAGRGDPPAPDDPPGGSSHRDASPAPRPDPVGGAAGQDPDGWRLA